MILRKCTRHLIVGLAALLIGGGAQAQLSITNFEFSSVAVDYPANEAAANPMSLQGSLGQTMVTVDPPTNTGQNLAFLGFWETGVKFRYIGQIEMEDYTGDLTGKPLEIRFWNNEEDNNDTVVTNILNASGNFVVDSWMNPAKVAGLSAKTPNSLRRRRAITLPSDPLQYPSASYTGLANFLLAGDAEDDNEINVFDLDLLIQGFDACDGDANYSVAPDFNGDGCIDVFDLDLLIRNFDKVGDE